MIRIAISDSNRDDMDIMIQYIKRLEQEHGFVFETAAFDDGEALCKSVRDNYYDIIILEVLFQGAEDGIETAKRIRAKGINCKIVFISACDEKLRELIHVEAAAFLDKPLQYEEFEKRMPPICYRIREEADRMFHYKKVGDSGTVCLKDIKYFESNRNHVVIHTVNGEIDFIQSLSHIWDKLKHYDIFAKPSKSYIVSLQYFSMRKNQMILAETGETVNIGRSFKEDTQDRWECYRRWKLKL